MELVVAAAISIVGAVASLCTIGETTASMRRKPIEILPLLDEIYTSARIITEQYIIALATAEHSILSNREKADGIRNVQAQLFASRQDLTARINAIERKALPPGVLDFLIAVQWLFHPDEQFNEKRQNRKMAKSAFSSLLDEISHLEASSDPNTGAKASEWAAMLRKVLQSNFNSVSQRYHNLRISIQIGEVRARL